MLQILQERLQQYLNQELSDVQDGLRKGRGKRDQIANILWNIKKKQENCRKISLSVTKLNHLTVWVTRNCGKFLKRWEYKTILPVCRARSNI